MRAGRYDKRIEIQEETASRDTHGAPTNTYAKVATRWARITDLSGRSYFNAQQVDSDITAEVELREAYDGLNPRHRFKHGDRILNISHIVRGQRTDYGRGQLCVCKEVQ